jgi:hypothetical protein
MVPPLQNDLLVSLDVTLIFKACSEKVLMVGWLLFVYNAESTYISNAVILGDELGEIWDRVAVAMEYLTRKFFSR